jgi:hypothetical protein
VSPPSPDPPNESSRDVPPSQDGAGPATEVLRLATTARRLLELENDIDGARSVLREADLAAREARLDSCDLWWARALLHQWEGDLDSASRTLEHALVLAQDAADRAREVRCLACLTQLELERGHPAAAEAIAKRLAERERRDATAFPVVVQLLARRQRARDTVADEELTLALYRLRSSSDARQAAFGLNAAAASYLRDGTIESARVFAAMALAIAARARLRSEVAVAVATLVRSGERAFLAEMDDLVTLLNDTNALNARARLAVFEASAWIRQRPLAWTDEISAATRKVLRPYERSPSGQSE